MNQNPPHQVIHFVILWQVNSTDSAALLGSGLVVNDTISWTKGEVLGRGAYGTVSMESKANKTFKHGEKNMDALRLCITNFVSVEGTPLP